MSSDLTVALVCPYSLDTPGGVATHVLGLARWLLREGHRPTVIAPGTREVDAGVPLTLLGRATRFRFNGSVAELAVRPAQARMAARAVRGADIVHVHEPLTPGIAYAASRAAERLVVTHHASFPAGPLNPLARLRSRRLNPRVRIAVSDAAAATARSVTGTDPVIIPNAIELPGMPVERSGRPRVVFLGRLDDPRKGFQVFARVAGLVQEAEFVAMGPGAARSPDVHHLGRVSDAVRLEVLGSADILLAPNLHGESFGLILAEALGCGAAVVASDLPAFRAVADDHRVASFFPVGDARAAATAVRRRLSDPIDPILAWRSAQRFGWDQVGPRVLSAYRAAGVG